MEEHFKIDEVIASDTSGLEAIRAICGNRDAGHSLIDRP